MITALEQAIDSQTKDFGRLVYSNAQMHWYWRTVLWKNTLKSSSEYLS